MNYVKWAGRAAAAAASIGLAAMSSGAVAQYSTPNCRYIARIICSHENNAPTLECFERELAACMAQSGGGLEAGMRVDSDKQREVRLAARPVPASTLIR